MEYPGAGTSWPLGKTAAVPGVPKFMFMTPGVPGMAFGTNCPFGRTVPGVPGMMGTNCPFGSTAPGVPRFMFIAPGCC